LRPSTREETRIMSKTFAGLSLWAIVLSLPARAESTGVEDAASDGNDVIAPTLEWLRECVIRRGVAARLVRIEALEDDGEAFAASAEDARRIVFWTKTRRLTQTVVIAIVAGGSYVRIQSCDLARADASHAKLQQLMTYVLDRNFAIVGAQFARDATDGEVALRSDVPCSTGIRRDAFLQVLERVLTTADDEAPRLWALLGDARIPRESR
jgi:hypothetical protein